MSRYTDFLFLIFIASILFFISEGFAFAQGELEVTYPTVPGATPPRSINIPLASALKYVYNFCIVIAGALSFFLLIRGGILYLFSQGRPALMNEAKKQITNSLFGLLIIFSSYLILNTINPQLTIFPEFRVTSFSPQNPTIPPEFSFTAEFNELPVATLITSEYSASAFLRADTDDPDLRLSTSTDPDTSREDYIYFFTATSSRATTSPLRFYPTDFQGGLHGRRLMRIHEVATTTLPVTHMIADLSNQLVEIAKELKDFDEKLYQATKECNCSNCNCPSCGFGLPGPCPGPECDPCRGNPCSPATIQKIQDLREKIPKFYENENDPIPCKIAEIKYLAEHFRRFLESDINWPLVKNDDYEDKSYYWSDEARELRNKIKECINASYSWESWMHSPKKGDALRDEFEKIEEIIWNSTTSLAFVENKGTYTPKTDPPQRDVETNIKHLEAIYNSLLDIKDRLNPYSDLFGSLDFMPWHSLIRFQAEAQMPEIKVRFGSLKKTITYPYNIPTIGEVQTSEDPANFYAPAMRELYPTEPQSMRPQEEKNVVFAQEEEEQAMTKTSCSRVVEIPIGNTIDEALRLMEDILRELKNIYNKGGVMIKKALEQIKEAEKLSRSSQELVDATDPSNIVPCEFVRCKTICHQTTIPTPLGDIILHNCIGCFFERVNGYWYTEDQINKAYFDIKTEFSKINSLYQSLLDAKESLYESFYKLNSEYPEKDPQHPDGHPKAGKRVPIGKKYCCTDLRGNCRNPLDSPNPGKGPLRVDEIEERDYTLKEKLAEVQKLLNRTRELVKKEPEVAREEPEAAKSVYRILLEELIELGYAKREELTNISPLEKLDLSNCTLLIAEVTALTQLNEEEKLLLNSKIARGEITEDLPTIIDLFDPEKCSPDPMLDCDYFNPASNRRRSPLSCYIYDGDIAQKGYPPEYRIPKYPSREGIVRYNLANNLFCCVITHE